MASSETIYYKDGNVAITNSRAVIGAKTYALSNVTSVAMRKQRANRQGGIVVAVLGFAGFAMVLALKVNLVVLLLCVVVFGIGVLGAVSHKDRYIVQIWSASGEVDALASEDRDEIERIVTAINQAIIARG